MKASEAGEEGRQKEEGFKHVIVDARRERDTRINSSFRSSGWNSRILANRSRTFLADLARHRLTESHCAECEQLARLDRLLLQTRIAAVKNANARLIAFQPHFRRPLPGPEPFRSLCPCETIVGVRRTGSPARFNDAEDNDRSPALTPKEIESRGDFE